MPEVLCNTICDLDWEEGSQVEGGWTIGQVVQRSHFICWNIDAMTCELVDGLGSRIPCRFFRHTFPGSHSSSQDSLQGAQLVQH